MLTFGIDLGPHNYSTLLSNSCTTWTLGLPCANNPKSAMPPTGIGILPTRRASCVCQPEGAIRFLVARPIKKFQITSAAQRALCPS
jgi:hypothetical protein